MTPRVLSILGVPQSKRYFTHTGMNCPARGVSLLVLVAHDLSAMSHRSDRFCCLKIRIHFYRLGNLPAILMELRLGSGRPAVTYYESYRLKRNVSILLLLCSVQMTNANGTMMSCANEPPTWHSG